MNDILQQIMNMIENTRTVPSISSFSLELELDLVQRIPVV